MMTDDEAFENGCDWAKSQILDLVTRRINGYRGFGASEDTCYALESIREEIKSLKLYEE